MALKGNDTCVVCGFLFDSEEHQDGCFNTPQAQGYDVGPFEEWDLVAWPKHYHGEQDMVEFLDQLDRPHLDGQPMNVGYVRRIYANHLKVEKAKVGMMGRTRRQPIPLDDPVGEMRLDTVRINDVVGKKEREHNEVYQQKKRERERRMRRFNARRDWAELPTWKRWVLYLTMSKGEWIDSRVTQLKEQEE